MAKTINADRSQYMAKTRPYREKIKEYLSREDITSDFLNVEFNVNASLKRIGLANDMLGLASNFIILSEVSQSMMRFRNNDALDEARKTLYKVILHLEETVTNFVDVSFSDYAEKLIAIESVSAEERYLLCRKLGLAVDLLQEAYGKNTKWRWSFVELEGRCAAVTKNIVDLKVAATNRDTQSPEYVPTVHHLNLIKKLLMQSANRYRYKYEISTSRIDDFKAGINFLSALKRIYIVMGESREANEVKKKLDTWNLKLEADIKKLDDQRKLR